MQAVRLRGQLVNTGGKRRLFAPNVRMEEVCEPILGPDHVLIEPASVGVCGSDLHASRCQAGGEIASFSGPIRPPVTLGHEMCGRVVACGDAVTAIRPGWWVVAETILNCGSCRTCVRGMPNHCPHAMLLGLTVDGALTQRVVVPARNCHRVDDRWPEVRTDPRIADTLTLVEPIACMTNAMSKVNLAPGARVLVIGAGPLGFAATQLACRHTGVPPIVVDRSAARCRLLSNELDTSVLHEEIAPDTIQRTVEGIRSVARSGGIDVLVEVAGVPGTCLAELARLLDHGSTIVYLARTGQELTLSADLVVSNGLRLVGSRGPDGPPMSSAIEHLFEAFHEYSRFITRTVDFENAPHWLMHGDYLSEGKTVVRVARQTPPAARSRDAIAPPRNQ